MNFLNHILCRKAGTCDAPLFFVVKVFLVILSLIRTSDLSVEGTSARKYKRKKYFSFVFLSLIRTFNPTDFRYSRSEKHKFIWFFSRLIVPLHNVCFLTMVKGEAFLG